MNTRVLALTFLLFLQNTSLSAMDLNETTVIINEAKEATQMLQGEFDVLVNEVEITNPQVIDALPIIETNNTVALINKELMELNTSTSQVIDSLPIIETNNTIAVINKELMELNTSNPQVFEMNKSIEINASIPIEDLNLTQKLSCKENNSTILLNGLTINLDENNTIEDNGCTDANLGTSAEGLIIFKTRIRPYCKINGETFAKQYMQEDWDDIYYDKEFKMEIIKACPNMKERYKDKWTPHLYQFTLEYASDSDAIPEC